MFLVIIAAFYGRGVMCSVCRNFLFVPEQKTARYRITEESCKNLTYHSLNYYGKPLLGSRDARFLLIKFHNNVPKGGHQQMHFIVHTFKYTFRSIEGQGAHISVNINFLGIPFFTYSSNFLVILLRHLWKLCAFWILSSFFRWRWRFNFKSQNRPKGIWSLVCTQTKIT